MKRVQEDECSKQLNKLWKGKRILITGGAGFIGSNLVEALNRFGAEVFTVDIVPNTSEPHIEVSQNNYLCINILSNDFREYLRSVSLDYVFHLAGSASVQQSVEKPFNDFESNLRVTLHLLENMRTMSNPPKLIYLSSAAVYGNPESIPISEDDITVPISPYGISKLAAERYLYVYANIHGLQAVSARPFSVFGPGQEKQVVYDIIKKISNNPNKLELYGSGREARDFIFITDLVDALLMIAERSRMSGEVYNIASGMTTEIAKIADKICNMMNVAPEIVYKGTVRPGVPLRWQADVTRLKSLGFNLTVDLNEGLHRTLDWYRETEGQK